MNKFFKRFNWINASAGTGKTTMIDTLIRELLEKEVNPQSIICLTFTRNAAFEMADRYSRRENRNDTMPRFETIHSFAKSIIPEKYQVINQQKNEEFVQEAIEFVLSNSEWHHLIDVTWEGWSSITSDLRLMLSNDKEGDLDLLKMHLPKGDNSIEISLSQETVNVLHKHKQGPLVSQIMSNNISVYRRFVNKEHKLHSKYLPENLLSAEEYPDESAELNQVFRQITNLVTQSIHSKNLQQSIYVNEFINEVRRVYSDIKESRRVIDFSDMILYAKKYLKLNPEKIKGIRHIFIDEAQDINKAQWELIYEIASDIFQTPDSSMTIVGDEKQIIYEFNGASKDLYVQIKANFQKMAKYLGVSWKESNLENNYRTADILVDFVSSMYKNNLVKSRGPLKGYIKTWSPIKDDGEAESSSEWRIPGAQVIPSWINLCIAEIKSLIKTSYLLNKERVAKPSDIMILVPKRCISIFLLIEELKKNGIPIAHSPFNIITDETVQEILGVAEIVLDPSNDVIAAGILKGAHFRWTNEELERVLVNRDSTLIQYMMTSKEPKVMQAYKTMQSWFDMPKDLYGFYSKLLFHSEYGDSLWESFPNETLIFWEKVVQHKTSSLAEFTHHIKNSTHTLSANINGVNITTIHSAKGCEAEIVFLCNSHTCNTRCNSSNVIMNDLLLLKGNYPMYNNTRNRMLLNQEEESMRLLYVALTRAKEQLYILPPLSSDVVSAKSWYSLIIQNLENFTESDGVYEKGMRPGLTKRVKYN